MTAGRRPKPEAVKDAQGNPGRRKQKNQADTPDAPTKLDGAPQELSDAARKVWDTIAPGLKQLRFLKDTDRPAFARYCEHAVKWWKLTKDLEDNGLSYLSESAHGKLERVRPNFLIRDRIERKLEALEDRFGMNPAARQQIMMRLAGIAPTNPGDGDLFANQQGVVSGQKPKTQNAPSAVGLLRAASEAKQMH